ncbi:acetoin dehydrogenase E2 subunit dihydrolipoyllysine-residue acetyltransferase [Thermoplasmatales archaeon]|nr:acetoin dehydrogenase E2 subunit dihydrolipoyllysine-residue acetyltransferase [Thermoplasmatales archaeon]
MRRSIVKTRYGNISYLSRPGTIPVIFLHGLGGTGNSWIRLDGLLDEKLGLYMIDLIGHGRSSRPEIPYTIENQCEALDDFVSELGLTDFILAGNSYGGWIALRYASSRRKAKKLILVDSAGINTSVGETGGEYEESFLKRLMSVSRYNDEKIMKAIVRNNARPEEKITKDQLSVVNVPTCIVWGGLDRIIPLEVGERLHGAIQGSIMEVIADAGHVPQVERPEELAGIINAFVSGQ